MVDVFFHDIPLDNIAGVKITDITVAPIQWSSVARQRPIRAGADFVRQVGGERQITMTFVLLNRNMEQRQDEITALNAWLKTDEPKRLVLPGYPGRYLMAICTEFPEAYLREYWQELRVVWTCYDPYWYSMTTRRVDCGTPFKVGGSAPPRMWITATIAETTDLTYWDGTDTMTFADVPAGVLVINLENQTAEVDGESCMAGYTFESSFIIPRTGQMTIAGSGRVNWVERWV